MHASCVAGSWGGEGGRDYRKGGGTVHVRSLIICGFTTRRQRISPYRFSLEILISLLIWFDHEFTNISEENIPVSRNCFMKSAYSLYARRLSSSSIKRS